jgi:UDP-N-acetylmuramyl tripeptide synthase
MLSAVAKLRANAQVERRIAISKTCTNLRNCTSLRIVGQHNKQNALCALVWAGDYNARLDFGNAMPCSSAPASTPTAYF